MTIKKYLELEITFFGHFLLVFFSYMYGENIFALLRVCERIVFSSKSSLGHQQSNIVLRTA